MHSLNQHILRTTKALARGPSWKSAAFYASAAERFYPLYLAFSSAEDWGSPECVREYLDLARELVLNPENAPNHTHAARVGLLTQTPHADDFDSVETTFAQDVTILIDAALRASADEMADEDTPIEAAFEALRVALCMERYGFLDLGSGPMEGEFEQLFFESGTCAVEIVYQTQDLEALSTARPKAVVRTLRRRSASNSYRAHSLLPTQAIQ